MDSISLTKIIGQRLEYTIRQYCHSISIISNQEDNGSLIADKITLLCSSDLLTKIVYRCAVTFPLANQIQLPPLEVAQALVQLLPSANSPSNILALELTTQVIPPGWIDLSLSDRSLAVWLQMIVEKLPAEKQSFLEVEAQVNSEANFLLQYVHARCCSLLRLGEREKLIRLKQQAFRQSVWSLAQPHPLIWLNEHGNFLLQASGDRRLLLQLLLTIDAFSSPKSQNWVRLAHNLSDALLDFSAECRIWGEVKQQNPALAQARLGLIALVQWWLKSLLQNKLGLFAPIEL